MNTMVAAMVALMPLRAAVPSPGAPPVGGTISIDARTASGEYDSALSAFAAAASEAFTSRGFTVLSDPGHAAYELDVVLSRADIGTSFAKVPGASKARLAGGLMVPFSTGASNPVRLQRVRLEMRIRPRGGTAVVWGGAAVTVRETDGGKDAERGVATDLSRALLRVYPNQPRGEMGIP